MVRRAEMLFPEEANTFIMIRIRIFSMLSSYHDFIILLVFVTSESLFWSFQPPISRITAQVSHSLNCY